MLKRVFLLSMLLGTSCLLADAVSIGRTRNGYPLIVPQPKSLEASSGAFVLPAKLTATAPEALDIAPLAKVYAETLPNGAVERSDKNALCRFEITKSGVPQSAEGYTLAVTNSGIAVRAREVHGLFNGMQTLNMMLRHRSEADRLKCCRVTDWPDMPMRGLFLQLGKCWSGPQFNVDRVCHAIDVLGSLKYNTLLLTFADNFPFQDSPFTKRKATFSREDVDKVLAAARRNHMEVIPYLQLISHGNWLVNHKDWEKLQEPNANAYCLFNPDIQPLIEKVVRETADIVKPRYFHIGLDEIEQCGFPTCPKCKAANLEQKIIEHLTPVKKILSDRGITPIIYMDQFFGFGEPSIQRGLNINKIPEWLGMDTIINSWEYGNRPSGARGEEIYQHGFKNLLYMSFAIDTSNCWRLPRVAKQMNALGNILAYWSMVPPTLDAAENARPGFYPSTITQANYCWNADDIDFQKIPMDSAMLLRELLDGPVPNAFQGKASPVVLDSALNCALAADPVLPDFDAKTATELKRIAAADPAKFDIKLKDGAPLAIVLSGCKYDGFAKEPVTIPVNTTATGGSFLMTSAAFNTFALQTSVYHFKFINIGALKFMYADGTTQELPLVFRKNMNDWNSILAGNACRIVVRGNDRNNSLFTLYAIDWRNPKPQAEIKEIRLSAVDDTFISPVMLACSLSDAGGNPTGARGAMNVAFPTQRVPVKQHPMVSFSNGVPVGIVSKGEGIGNYEYGAVHDAERGEVLELRASNSKYLSRVLADLPIETPRDFESIIFDFKFSEPQSIFRPDCYVADKWVSKYLGATGFFADVDVDAKWYRVCIPRQRFAPSGGGIDPKNAEKFSIRFFMHKWADQVSVRISDVSYGDGVMPCRINVTAPTK